MLPTKKELKLARAAAQRLSQLPNQRKGGIHYGVFLLCFGAGLRVSEAISFDLTKQVNGFFLVKSKNHQTRKVVVSEQIVQELKENNYWPNQTNRFNFTNYCKRVKKEAKLPAEVELTPHTGRRSWATYQAENGVPLPVLSKMLGHKQLETTAQYYWREVYSPEESKQLQLATKTEILNSVKDKKFWREYNAKRKKYLSQKNKKRYEKNKKERSQFEANKKINPGGIRLNSFKEQRSLDKVKTGISERVVMASPCLPALKLNRMINTTNLTTYACQELANPFKSADPPKSRLEISR